MAKKEHFLSTRILQKGKCPECGGSVNVKANKNGIAYFFCNNIDKDTFGRCNHKTGYSPKLSAKLCAAYCKKHNIENPHGVPANDNHAPLKLVTASQPDSQPASERQPAANEPEKNVFGL